MSEPSVKRTTRPDTKKTPFESTIRAVRRHTLQIRNTVSRSGRHEERQLW
ncbi:MAG: hypothetical protein H8E37_05195 [Planctomycetes bacterium]|nr:hypothetical protein [Planctomycetota bacterium]